MYRGQKPRTLSGYCQPRHGRVRDKSDCPFRASDGGSPHCARKRNCNPNKKPLQVFCGVFYCRLGAYRDIFGDGSAGEKPFQILLHSKISAQKVSEPEPAGQIRPNAFKFPQSPAIFRNFPPPKLYFKHYSPAFARRGFHKKPLGAVRAQAAACARTIRKSRSLPRRARAREKRDGRNR